MVSGLPHSGQIPPAALVLAGSQFTSQTRCPSAWYLPSSGKKLSVPARPSPVRSASLIAKKSSSVASSVASLPSAGAECASELATSWYRSRLETRQFIPGSEESPVSTAKIWSARSA